MTGRFGRFPERPPSEVEWEELLVRYEIAPRALSVTAADADPERADGLVMPLGLLVAWETWAAEALAAMRDRRPAEGDGFGVEGAGGEGGAARLVEAFARLRGRNFAAVQRRGLGVWEWTTEAAGERVTAYQLLLASVEMDATMLAAVRAAAKGE